MSKSKWSKEDLATRLSALRFYCKLTATEMASGIGRTPIYLNQMATGRASISMKTENAVRKCLRRQAKEIASKKLEHPAQGAIITAISNYLKELSNE